MLLSSIPPILSFLLVKCIKEKNYRPNGITCSIAHDTKTRFNTYLIDSSLHQKWVLISSLEFSDQHQEGNLPVRPLHFSSQGKRQSTQMLVIPSHFPPEKVSCLKITLYFLLLIVPLPHPSSYKSLSFCTTPWSILLVARLDTEQIMNCLVETN